MLPTMPDVFQNADMWLGQGQLVSGDDLETSFFNVDFNEEEII